VGKVFLAALLAASVVTPAISAQNLMSARGFVAQLYIKKTNDRAFRFASPRNMTADLYDLMQNAGTTLNYDPLCQCQNNDGLSSQIVSISGGGDRAVVGLLLRFDADRIAPPQRITLMLTRAPLAGWKVADLRSTRTPSLKAWLARRQRAGGIARAR
jgi:hypothetical protein